MNFFNVRFLKSVFQIRQLPAADLPEIAFAGRSNVGKSSLINRLVNRVGLVKTSSRPGKTRSLNYFMVDEQLYLVDLPGYGFARVSRKEQQGWQRLIETYLSKRSTLCCVVVIIDIRHPLKEMDRNLVDWLRHQGRSFLPVYTKADKLSGNSRRTQAAVLDAGLGMVPDDRIVFSARTGQGCDELRRRLAEFI